MEENFKASLWYRMAAVLGEDAGQPSASSIILKRVASKGTNLLKAFDKGGEEILAYLSSGPDLGRFLERFEYGDLVYIKELGILAETEKPDSKRKFVSPSVRNNLTDLPWFS